MLVAKMNEDLSIGKVFGSRRCVIVWIDDATGELSLDDSNVANWELVGIIDWLDKITHDEEEDAE